MRGSVKLATWLCALLVTVPGWPVGPPRPRAVEITAPDGTGLKATYYSAGKPAPSVLLLHQINRDRSSWNGLAIRLAAAGINTLALDLRGHGESGGTRFDKLTPAQRDLVRKQASGDIDAALDYLAAQPGAEREVIGLGGAGVLGVESCVEAAMRHRPEVKSLVLLSGQTFLEGRQFMRETSHLPALFVWSDSDEYLPTAEVMEWLYDLSPNPGKKLIRYRGQEPPWLGYEDGSDKVAATGNHGTDLLQSHAELSAAIVDWFGTTLIQTPGRAPATSPRVAGALSPTLLEQIEMPGGAARVKQELIDRRKKNGNVQLWPWVVLNVMGYDNLQAGNTKLALEIFKLNVFAYPRSPDAASSLSDGYLAVGDKERARQYAEKAMALLASDTSDSEARREVIRRSAEANLKQVGAGDAPGASPGR